ncbi:hypothetical protein B0H13DRAFT_1908687 [Mycena leptocephala]|nr:hypothetical protein B0H13DRAFT_1908687 [Mycena leptocephala]
MYCKAGPRVPQFYHHCYALGVVTAKLKFRDEEKKGLPTNTLAAVKREVEKVQVNIQLMLEKENVRDLEMAGRQKKRHLVAADSEYSFKSPWCNTDVKAGRARSYQGFRKPGLPAAIWKPPNKTGVARGCQIELSLVVVKELRRRFSRAVTEGVVNEGHSHNGVATAGHNTGRLVDGAGSPASAGGISRAQHRSAYLVARAGGAGAGNNGTTVRDNLLGLYGPRIIQDAKGRKTEGARSILAPIWKGNSCIKTSAVRIKGESKRESAILMLFLL